MEDDAVPSKLMVVPLREQPIKSETACQIRAGHGEWFSGFFPAGLVHCLAFGFPWTRGLFPRPRQDYRRILSWYDIFRLSYLHKEANDNGLARIYCMVFGLSMCWTAFFRTLGRGG